jgi:hypothetical protein
MPAPAQRGVSDAHSARITFDNGLGRVPAGAGTLTRSGQQVTCRMALVCFCFAAGPR